MPVNESMVYDAFHPEEMTAIDPDYEAFMADRPNFQNPFGDPTPEKLKAASYTIKLIRKQPQLVCFSKDIYEAMLEVIKEASPEREG